MRTHLLIIAFVFALIATAIIPFLFSEGVISYTSAPADATTTAPTTTIITAATTAPVQPQDVTFRVVETGTHAANVSARKNYAAHSQAGLVNLWEMAHGEGGTPLPQINFSKEYAIGVFAGQKPTGGHAIVVASVTDSGNTRTVAVTLTSPGEGCIVTQALTNPFQIVAVPIGAASLAHKDTLVSRPCN